MKTKSEIKRELQKQYGDEMQKRIIQVQIETIDDKHCSLDCPAQYELDKGFCQLTKATLKYDKIGYIRTKACIKNEEGVL